MKIYQIYMNRKMKKHIRMDNGNNNKNLKNNKTTKKCEQTLNNLQFNKQEQKFYENQTAQTHFERWENSCNLQEMDSEF